ncbi:MAG: hypothetical protein V3571_06965 [Pseudodesulfovibrio sp.]
MRNSDNSSESIRQKTLQELMVLTRQFAVVDTLMGRILKEIAGSRGKAPFDELSLAEIHFLAAVEEFTPCNGALLTQKIGLTKGGVSKMASRLSGKGLIVSEKMAGDNKSQYFILTEKGQFACRVHNTLHEIAKDRIIRSLPEYTADEMTAFNGMLIEISAAIAESSADISVNFRQYLAEDGIDVA